MRVIHVITRLIIGGAQENTVASVLGLRRQPGMDVTLISGPSTGAEGSLESNFRSSPQLLSILPSLVRPLHPWKDLRALSELTWHFVRQCPDIVHTHSGKAGILGRLAAHRAKVPCIIHTIHGPSFGPFQGSIPNLLFKLAEHRAGRCTSHFVAVAEAMMRQYLAAGIGRPEQYTCIRSGFDLGPFLAAKNDPALRVKLGLGPTDFVVGNIARLFKLKGHADLLEAAPRIVKLCPQIKFLLVGDGILRQELEARIQLLGLQKHFVFTGLVAPAEIPSLVGIMDVLVHLSRREGLARSLAQALAAGRAVVAYDCDGAREVCVAKQTGILLKIGDIDGLVEGLQMLAGDAELRHGLGRRGQELVKNEFSVEQMVDRLHELYQKLVPEQVLALT